MNTILAAVILTVVFWDGSSGNYEMASLEACEAISRDLAPLVESVDCYTEFFPPFER